jgi:hypothetical protein
MTTAEHEVLSTLAERLTVLVRARKRIHKSPWTESFHASALASVLSQSCDEIARRTPKDKP